MCGRSFAETQCHAFPITPSVAVSGTCCFLSLFEVGLACCLRLHYLHEKMRKNHYTLPAVDVRMHLAICHSTSHFYQSSP